MRRKRGFRDIRYSLTFARLLEKIDEIILTHPDPAPQIFRITEEDLGPAFMTNKAYPKSMLAMALQLHFHDKGILIHFTTDEDGITSAYYWHETPERPAAVF